MHKKERIAVLIEAYNEEKNIGRLLSSIDDAYERYVVDDASTDKTCVIAGDNGAKVISQAINLGQGLAFITGMKVLLEKDYDFIVHLDADGQHAPEEIPVFIEKFKGSDADVVQGSRTLGSGHKNAPWARKVFLAPLTWVLNRLTGYELSDSMCGFRAFRVRTLKKVEHLFDDMVEPEYLASEMWIRFARAGLKVVDVPVSLSDRGHGFSYKGLFRYGWGVISAIIRTKLDTYKY